MKILKTFENFKDSTSITFENYIDQFVDELEKRFDLSPDEMYQVIDYYREDLELAFHGHGGYTSVAQVVDSFVENGKLKWKK